MGALDIHAETVAEIAARLDLREPNRLAVETVSAEISQWFDADERPAPFEAVLDVATGVGKTYVMAGSMELLYHAYGVTNFVVIAPGGAILNKTRDNFTAGTSKSLLAPLSFDPVLVTADNFASPSMRKIMDDTDRVKIYLFTVQSLLRPTSKQGRKVHKFQEGLGREFYAHLQKVEQLAVFADEHHAYFGKAFSAAVRDLNPWVLLGLTATPHKQTPKDQIIYRYPLAAAIADKHVKTPVVVGRKDDRSDPLTKLSDGVTLLRAKEEAVASYADSTGASRVNPVMLVVAKTIDEANEYGSILRSTEFFGGAYADAVLVVHSESSDSALEALTAVENADSRVRIIISVGMLKEGWDVKNVYVIASMRSSVSEILTEQTLGRGMRLPFGAYTDIEILDTLEVIAHERYEELLRKAGVLNEAFVDYRTRAVLRTNSQGQQVVVRETVETDAQPVITSSPDAIPSATTMSPEVSDGEPAPVVTTVEQRTQQAERAGLKMKQPVAKDLKAPQVLVPILRMSAVQSFFSLADITDTDAFIKLGKSLAADPEGELSRTLLGARVVMGRDGIRRTQLVPTTAADRVKSKPTLFPLDELREQLTEIVLGSSAVPARKNQRGAFQPLLNAFIEGMGSQAQTVLSANLERAGARLVQMVATEQRRFMVKPSFQDVVEVKTFDPLRVTDKEISDDRYTAFSRAFAYKGWKKSMFALVWFDSSPERTVATLVDDDKDDVAWWARLHTNDVPILWSSAGRNYNPDLLVIEKDDTHWIVEIKMDKEITSEEVAAKREAAMRWANHVTSDDKVKVAWKYLLISETDINTAKGSWRALKKLAS
jgi:type III restriction enzyme